MSAVYDQHDLKTNNKNINKFKIIIKHTKLWKYNKNVDGILENLKCQLKNTQMYLNLTITYLEYKIYMFK